MDDFFGTVYLLLHLPILYSAFIATHWDEYVEVRDAYVKKEEQRPKHEILLKWAVMTLFLIAFDLLLVIPSIKETLSLDMALAVALLLLKFIILFTHLRADPEPESEPFQDQL
ncbi:hypothetical protein COX00_04325 [Candidatus Uhrbacteria bacterium CG22_combo_CG10-13_8_21_14_all_47_17]|uniref:Uncharacterized protein n=1 Tax=Candidatus Uhrbacteria bacterium CG22_combo_CG10-13_8_21_14_all_47_17 TaxID=1975041 RepID=A0A2H0BRK7_9BACT|nr:MAG: hypothetical protein COX00_04325 [Candidatus Uhrbacteria bacterium CG22_combo_CG10-13_8_21_14_all_47_17]